MDKYNIGNTLMYEFINYINFIKKSSHIAYHINSLQEFINMIAKSGNIDIQDNNDCTPLMHLCFHFDKFDCVQLYENILTYHPNLNLQNKDGETALMIACEYRRFDVAKLLLDYGADISNSVINFKDKCGKNILSRVLSKVDIIDNNIMEIVKLLLTYDMTIDNLSQTLIDLGMYYNNNMCELISLLIEKGANVNFQDSGGKTALMEACYYVNLEYVKTLLSHNANINIIAHDGSTALWYICFSCYEPVDEPDYETPKLIIRLLLDNDPKPDINVQDNDCKMTPLSAYCNMAGCDSEIIKLLCNNSTINSKDIDNNTPLMIYCKHANILDLEIIKMFISAGIDVNSQHLDDKSTALMYVVSSNEKYDVLKLILALAHHNANINLTDVNGHTALAHACIMNVCNSVQLLLEYGAELHHGLMTAYDLTTDPYIKSLIKRWLPQNAYKNTNIKQCSICSDIDNNTYIQLHCKHVFHYTCIDRWLFDHRTCPECRASIY